LDTSFWMQRWIEKNIAFHQKDYNKDLIKYFPLLGLTFDHPNEYLFVPLCGKTLDMIWAWKNGANVLGIELSEIAVKEFFAQNNLPHEIIEEGKFKHFKTLNSSADKNAELSVLCGDFFNFDPKNMSSPIKIMAVYDRAALVALPLEMRTAYRIHLEKILNPGAKILLITYEYPQSIVEGPPFSVNFEELMAEWGESFLMELLGREESETDKDSRFRQAGLMSLQKSSYLLTKS
jgi:thiopurine S-methyltransferase